MRKITILLLLVGTVALAQRPSDFQRLSLEMARQQFDATNNAAGMGLFQPMSGSKTQLQGFHEWGDFHLAQEGDSDTGFKFSTLRYDSFSDKLFMKGSFFYSFDRERNRIWSDVMDPWFSIPFIYGSRVAKNYDTHDCGLTFDLYTAPLAQWVSVGVRTSYEVKDVSGLRDPRPRTGYLDYQLVPSVLFTFGNHHVGLDAGYGYTKEKLTNITTIQSYPNLYYYKMSGLDHIDGAIAAYSGFKRQFAGRRFLGDLSYSFTADALRVLVSGGVEYKRLDANGDMMQSPGSYNAFTYKGVADVQYAAGSLLHRLHLTGNYKDAGADELLQELTNTKDPVTGATTQTWETLYEYKNRYMLKTSDFSLAYTLWGGLVENDYRWSVEVEARRTGFNKECFLPYSGFQAAGWNLSLGGSLRLFQKNHHKVGLAAKGLYHRPGACSQELYYQNLYTEEVLQPDLAYYSSAYFGGNADLTWQFPLNLGKAGWANGYVRLEGGAVKASPSGSLAQVSLAVGLFTF